MLGAILCCDTRSPRSAISADDSAERCWSGRTGLTANQFHLKRVTGVRIPASPPFSDFFLNLQIVSFFPTSPLFFFVNRGHAGRASKAAGALEGQSLPPSSLCS